MSRHIAFTGCCYLTFFACAGTALLGLTAPSALGAVGASSCKDVWECVGTTDLCAPSDPGACRGTPGDCRVLMSQGPTVLDFAVPPVGSPPVEIDLASNSAAAEPTPGEDCTTELDPGWYHAFTVDDYAKVTWDYSNNSPPIPVANLDLYADCPCSGPLEVIAPDASGNYFVEWTVRPGTYYYRVLAGQICQGTTRACASDTDCDAGVPCIDLKRAYQAKLIVGSSIPAACCLEDTCEVWNSVECDEAGGDWLGDLTPNPIPVCSPNPCSFGSCCFDTGACRDVPPYEEPDECRALGGTYHGHVSCDARPCFVPPGRPDELTQPDDWAVKNRYLTIVPSQMRSVPMAIRIELVSMKRCSSFSPPLACSLDSDCPPGAGTCEEDPSVSVPQVGWIGVPFEPVPGEFVARVLDGPVFRIWDEEVVHVGDCEIVPVATYEMRATPDGIDFSEPVVSKPPTKHILKSFPPAR